MDSTGMTSVVPAPPEACRVRSSESENERWESDRDLEATELVQASTSGRNVLGRATPRWQSPLQRWWKHHIQVAVPSVSCRDHLANERTFLGYLRTSVALSVLGVIIAQLYTLQHSPHPSHVFGYYILGKPIAAIMQISALAVVLLGFSRFMRQQSAMTLGKVIVGGWEVNALIAYSTLLLVGLLAVHIGVDIYKSVS